MENDRPRRMPNVPPFVKFVCANVPMVFDDSLSYYEALCALWKYVQGMTDVINNNATLEEEFIEKFNVLSGKFDELKTYVDTYFDNLDVQEEINNKLDQMAEDGQLADIISQYLNSTALFGYDNVASMKAATNLVNGSYARTLGYYAKNDGGSGLYKIRYITNDDVVDEGSIIEITADPENRLIAELIVEDNTINVKQFGAKADGTTDDANAIQAALTFAGNRNVIFDYGVYAIKGALNFTDNYIDGNDATIKAVSTFVGNDMATAHGKVTIKNIKFDANNVAKNCIGDSNDLLDINIDNCTFTGTTRYVNAENYALNSAVYLTGKNIVMTNCNITDNLSHGARLKSPHAHTTVNIENCKFINNGSKTEGSEVVAIGLMHNGGGEDGTKYDKVTISNCYATGNANTGIAPHACNNIVIDSCVCNANGEHGICLMDGKNAIISDCICLNNDRYGIRLQGDYGTGEEDPYRGYKNCTITGCYLNCDGIDMDGNLSNVVIDGNSFVYAFHDTGASIKGIRIGRLDEPTDFIKKVTITNNNFSGYLVYPIQAFIDIDSTSTFDNLIDGKRTTLHKKGGGSTDQWLCNTSSSLKYGNTNNKLSNPTNFSNWTLSSGATCVNNVITRGTDNMVARTSFTVTEPPRYVAVVMKFSDYTDGGGIGVFLRFRDGADTILGGTDRQVDVVSGNYMCRIFDVSKMTFTTSSIAKIEVGLLIDSTASSAKFEYCYCSLTDEPPVLPNVIS